MPESYNPFLDLLGPRSRPGARLLTACQAVVPRPDAGRTAYAIVLSLLDLRFGDQDDRYRLETLANATQQASFPTLPAWKPLGIPGGRQPFVQTDTRTIEQDPHVASSATNTESSPNPPALPTPSLPPLPPATPLLHALRHAAQTVTALPWPPPGHTGTPRDWLGPLHARFVPPSQRRRLGEHYTPTWLVRRLVSHLQWPPLEGGHFLDPACGSGAFLLEALRLLQERCPDDTPQAWLDRLIGVDIEPLAVRTARLNLRIAAAQEGLAASMVPRVYQADALGLVPPCLELPDKATHVAGNPPWVSWEHLGPERRASGALWEALGLFPHSGWEARMGAGKKDLSMLFVALAAERWLVDGGSFGWVLPRSLATSVAAAGLRRQFSQGRLVLTLLEDLGRLKVFRDAPAPAMLLVGKRVASRAVSRASRVRCLEWSGDRSFSEGDDLEEVLEATRRHSLEIEVGAGPPDAPWVALPGGADTVRRLLSRGSDYQAMEGANTGGANGVYWVQPVVSRSSGRRSARRGQAGASPDSIERGGEELVRIRNLPSSGRKVAPRCEAWVEASRILPLVRGRDVRRWHAAPSRFIVMVQDPERRQGIDTEVLKREAPHTLAYLKRFAPLLTARPLFRKYFAGKQAPFYSIYNVGVYTFSPWKVLWREVASHPTAAVIGPDPRGRPVIPDHKLMFIPCASSEEAHYVCAILNAPLVTLLVSRLCTTTSMGTRLLKQIPIPRHDPAAHVHRSLAALSRERHASPHDPSVRSHVDDTLDQFAAQALGVPEADRVLLLQTSM